MGLNARRSMTLPSPFDYPSQGLLYVPRNLPQPSSPQFTDAVFEAALPVIEAAGGGVFVLCTTLRAVDRIATRLRDIIERRGWENPLLVQGDASRTELLDRFRAYGNAILVAVRVSGKASMCVAMRCRSSSSTSCRSRRPTIPCSPRVSTR